MDARTFLDNFGTIADAPGGVDRLRGLIRDLAARGKLVSQDVADGSGAHFIKRVAQQRLRRLETGRSRGGLDITGGLTVEAPYSLPEGWEWTNFGAACINRDSERIPVRSSDRALRQGMYDYYGASGVIDKIDDYLFDGELLLIGEDGANLTLRSTPIAFMASGRFWVNNHAHVIDSLSSAALRYLAIYVNSIDLKPYLTGIAQPKLNQKRLNSIPVPIPPEAEQGRIVAKVDELMQLCDDLEAGQQARHHVTTRLRTSSLDALTTAESDDDLHTAWSRIHTNWEALTDHPDSIDVLRQTILQLAVRGTLVDQRSTEGCAEELLLDIAAEREQLLACGLMRKPRTLTEVQPPYALPPTWRWVRFGSLLTDLSYGTAKKCRPAPAPGFPVLRIPNIAIETGGIDFRDLKYAELSVPELTKWAVATGDLLIIRSNGSARLVGRSVVVPEAAAGMAFAGYLMRAKLCGVYPHYVRIALETPGIRAQIEGPIRTTSGVKNVNSTEITSLQIPLPPLAEQQRIVERVNQLDRRFADLGDALLQRTEASRRLAAAIA